MLAPFVSLKKTGGQIAVRGTRSRTFGHTLKYAPDRPPDGIFVEWSWDGARLLVRNDRYGFYPIFYFRRPEEICLSPSIPQLLAEGAPTEWDDAAMAAFLRLGFFMGEDTPFRAIRALPPAATLEWRDGHLRLSGGASLGQAHDMVRADAIEAYIALFRQAIRRRLPPDERFAVPLSGGRDSRHILFELCEAGYRPQFCVTMNHFPPRSSEEVETARRVAGALDLPHVVLPQAPSRLAAELRKNLATSFCSDEHAWMLPMADYLRGRVDAVYDGLGGSALTGYLSPLRLGLFNAGLFTELCDSLFVTQESDLRNLLTPAYYRRWNRDAAIQRITLELRTHAGAANPIYSFHFWNQVRREIALAPFGVLREIEMVFCPFLDHDLFDFLASIPARNLLDQAFHDETIQRAYPRYADIPFEPPVPPPAQDWGHFRRFARELATYTVAHRRSNFIRSRYLLPRLLKRALDADWTKFRPTHFFAIYLLQLERVAGGDRLSSAKTSVLP